MEHFEFHPKDAIALLVVGGVILFKMTGHDGVLDPALALIVGYYFAKRTEHRVVVTESKLPVV